MMDKVNVAVIGVGAMGKNHARVFSELENSNLVAICDSNEQVGKEIADKFKAKFYSDLKEMLEKENIDAISICVPTKLHKETTLSIINKKIHVQIVELTSLEN